MWVILWKYKGLVLIGLAALGVIGLIAAVKIQTGRLESAQSKITEIEAQRDVAIEAHDQLAREWERQKAVLAERDAARAQQEKDNARLQRTIREVLVSHRPWADGLLPASVVQTLSSLSTLGGAAAVGERDAGAGVFR